jgi:hypothetical protein
VLAPGEGAFKVKIFGKLKQSTGDFSLLAMYIMESEKGFSIDTLYPVHSQLFYDLDIQLMSHRKGAIKSKEGRFSIGLKSASIQNLALKG